MKNRLARAALFLLLICSLFAAAVLASGGVSVSTGSLKIQKGGKASFTVKASNAAGKINISSSDTSVATVSEGSLWLDNSSASITVKGIKTGSCKITVKCVDVSTYDEETVSGTYTVKVTVYEKEASSEKTSEKTSEKPAKPEKPSEPKKSGNADLKALSLVGFEMVEEFSPDRTEYTAYAPDGITKAEVDFKTDSSKAKASLSGEDLQEGWNEVKILVTAENGDKKTYIIRIYCQEKPTEFFSWRGQSLGVVKNVDLITLEGYEAGEDLIFRPAEGDGPPVRYLIDPESGNTGFYLFDEKGGKVLAPFRPIRIGEKTCYPVDAAETEPPGDPSLFALERTDWEETGFDAWHYTDPALADFTVWALADKDGTVSFYRYDAIEGTWQRYVPEPVPEVPEPEPEPESEPESESEPVTEEESETGTEPPVQESKAFSPLLAASLAAAAGGIVLSAVLFVLLLAARRRAKKGGTGE